MRVVADKKIPGLSELLADEFDVCFLPLEEINSQTLKEADILICRSVLPVNQNLLEGTRVSIVATATSGIDHIDVQYLEKKGISLFSAPGSNAQAVADYMLWILAYLEKNRLLSGKNAGIIGVGHVGEKVKHLLETLGFNVLLNDPPKALSHEYFSSVNLNEIAKQDLICVHAALSLEPCSSYHLLSDDWFKQVNKNAVLINAARGAIIDTPALLSRNGPLKYALDVFEHEPHIDEKLIENAFISTPHIAGHTIESFYRASKMIVDSIKNHLGMSASCETHSHKLDSELTVDARTCAHWYDVVLHLYDFMPKVKLAPNNFYLIRESHRYRHDFSSITIQVGSNLPKTESILLKQLGLNLTEIF